LKGWAKLTPTLRVEDHSSNNDPPTFLCNYFGSRLHWLGRLPLNWKFAPTTTGWSEVTRSCQEFPEATLQRELHVTQTVYFAEE